MRDPERCVGCKCAKCGHVWIAAYLPLNMAEVAKMMKRVYCPVCLDTKPLVAKTEEIAAVLTGTQR